MEISRIRQVILAYLLEHPTAGDTLDGIVQWWLGGGTGPIEREDVEEAVKSLVSEKVLLKKERDNAEPIYLVNTSRIPGVRP